MSVPKNWVHPPTRPFCASSPEAARMSEAEFWENVNASMSGTTVEELGLDHYEPEPPDRDEVTYTANPCPVCGSFEACMYDPEGRPMIHAVGEGETNG